MTEEYAGLTGPILVGSVTRAWPAPSCTRYGRIPQNHLRQARTGGARPDQGPRLRRNGIRPYLGRPRPGDRAGQRLDVGLRVGCGPGDGGVVWELQDTAARRPAHPTPRIELPKRSVAFA